jgi:fatty acid desaturase
MRLKPGDVPGCGFVGAKLLIAVGLTLWVSVPYYTLQRFPVFSVTTMPESALDRLVPFGDDAIWLYLSLFLLLPVPLVLVHTRDQLRRYATGVAGIGLLSHIGFALFPTAIARPAAGDANWAYRLVVLVDTPLNACPSLHASLAVFSVLCGGRWLGQAAARPRARHARLTRRLAPWALWLWLVAILGATLVTKQHVLVDLVAGAALALTVYVAVHWKEIMVTSLEPSNTARAAPPAPPRPRPIHAVQVKVALSVGVEARLAELRRLDLRQRLAELTGFGLLWPAGTAVTLAGLALPAGLAHYALRGAGAVVCAIALLHEGMHRTLFRNRWWNRWVAVALGAPVLMSFSAYKVMHLRHHAYLGDPRDPDDYQNYTRNRTLLLLMHVVRLLVGSFLYIAAIPVLALRYGAPVERRRVIVEYAVLAVVYAAMLSVVPGTILVHAWAIPVVLVAYMTNLRGFVQHSVSDARDPYLASRTILAHPLVEFCLLNENYHLEHHLFPEVPNYRLREIHELIWRRLPRAVAGTSYLGFLAQFVRATLAGGDSPIGLTFPAGAVAWAGDGGGKQPAERRRTALRRAPPSATMRSGGASPR